MIRTLSVPLLWLLSGGFACAAQYMPTLVAEARQSEELDEVQVVGKRLRQLQHDIITAENRFFALYNELNTDNDFDVHCSNELRTNTHIVRGNDCKPVYLEKAQMEEARGFLTGDSVQPAELVQLQRYPDYMKNMVGLVMKNPPLLRLIFERSLRQAAYEKARAERFKGHWIVFN